MKLTQLIHAAIIATAVSPLKAGTLGNEAPPAVTGRADFSDNAFQAEGGFSWFSGSIDTSGGARIVESSIGFPVGSSTPYPNYVRIQIANVQAALYPSPGETYASIAASTLPFRYTRLLYKDGVNDFQNVFDDPSIFDADEIDIIAQQTSALADALRTAPESIELRHALLDICYDLAVAKMQFAKFKQEALGFVRLGLTSPSGLQTALNNQDTGIDLADGPAIDREIALYSAMIADYDSVIAHYSELLCYDGGVNDAHLPGLQEGEPFGYYIFRSEQTRRDQFAPSTIDPATNEHVTLPGYDEAPVFNGYKDLRILTETMRLYTRASLEKARLLGVRRTGTDLDDARTIVSTVTTEVSNDMAFLDGMFPGTSFLDSSGMEATRTGVQNAVAELGNLLGFLNQTANILGLDKDFLQLWANAGNQFHTYDIMGSRYDQDVSGNIFNDARTKFANAKFAYEEYRATKDKTTSELSNIASEWGQRIFDITGQSLENLDLGSPEPGSELELINSSIALTATSIDNLELQRSNLSRQITTAAEAVTNANSIQDTIDDATVEYLGESRSTYDDLGSNDAISTLSQSLTDTVNAAASVDGIATAGTAGLNVAAISVIGATNAMIQTATATRRVDLERRLDHLSTQLNSTIATAEAPLTVNQAQLEQFGILRDQISLELEIEQARGLLGQQIAEKVALLREVERATQEVEADADEIRGSYFADPIHLSRAGHSVLLADLSFTRVQRIGFAMIRALEYKWGTPFSWEYLGTQYDKNLLFQLRNWDEFSNLLVAMDEFDAFQESSITLQGNGNDLNGNPIPKPHLISLRDDILAPDPTPTDPSNADQRIDLVTGETIEKAALFRRELQRRLEAGEIVIDIDTFALKNIQNGLFVAPNYNDNGILSEPGRWLDKIDNIYLHIVDRSASGLDTSLTLPITYAGTCYFRSQTPPCLDVPSPDPSSEFLQFPFRFYQPSGQNSFTVLSEQLETANINRSSIPAALDVQNAINPAGRNFIVGTQSFRERSVAATGWKLVLTSSFLNNIDLENIDDIEIIITHLDASRSQCE